MSWIFPNSVINVMRGVPLNPNYKDTIMFGDIGEQQAYFESKVVYTFDQQSYQRANKNTCRVKINAESVYDCNYLHFRNTGFGQKNFYAFIINIEYINHNVTEITYEIDVLQTWLFEWKNGLGACYVEREHSATDEIGEHLLPEPVEVDEYLCNEIIPAGFNETIFCLFVAQIVEGSATLNGGMYDNLYSVQCFVYDCNIVGTAELDAKLDEIYSRVGGKESIVGLFVGPKAFAPVFARNYVPYYDREVLRPLGVSGYTPNNNKLLTAPFVYLNVDTLNDSKNYNFEYFQSGNATFKCYGSCVGNASVICVPLNYKTYYSSEDVTQQVVMGGYPMCIIPVNSVNDWLANNGVYHVLTGLGSVASTAFGIATANPVATVGGIAGMVHAGTKAFMELNRENTSRGTVATSINVQNKTKDIYFKVMAIRADKAKSIDDFFSRYGYTCERVKVPNLRVRNRWTFTKTRGCIVNGNLPADDKETISKIFDNGITFWTTAGNVGDYVMNDNNPI